MDGSSPNQNAPSAAHAPNAQVADPTQAPPAQTSADLVKYLVVELDVPRENHIAFQTEMKNLVEVMFDYKRWELVFATYPITGKVNRFVHIWKIPDESTVVEVMRAGALGMGHKSDPDNATSLEEQFRRSYQLVQSLIVDTRHTLVTSLPYDPNHVGYQSQTILIDSEGEAFAIDHDELREKKKNRDIAAELEKVRANSPRRRMRHGKPSAAPRAKQQQPSKDLAKLERIQDHLNRGSAVAKLKTNGQSAILVNLATLKPRSVFQKIETAAQIASKGGPAVKVTGNGKVDMPAELVIATPWGAVYSLKVSDLGTIAKPIAQGKRAAVNKALKPIIEDETPLAAIPEERDNIIGDGCACYVINLKSFVQ